MNKFIVLALLALLASTQAATICDTYGGSTQTSQRAYLTAAVNTVVSAVTTAGTPTASFFSGVTDVPALKAKLEAYFGLPAVLGCSQANLTYTGRTNMTEVHASLNINKAAYEYFNSVTISTMQFAATAGLAGQTAGQLPVNVTVADFNGHMTAASDLLESFREGIKADGSPAADNKICFAADCNTKPYNIWVGRASVGTGADTLTCSGVACNQFAPVSQKWMPIGNTVRFIWASSNSHSVRPSANNTFVSGSNTGMCGQPATAPSFFAGLAATNVVGTNWTSGDFVADTRQWFHCTVGSHCSGSGMFGVAMSRPNPTTTSSNTGGTTGTGTTSASGFLAPTAVLAVLAIVLAALF